MTSDKSFLQGRPHPWHGLEIGPNPPEVVNAYIEITPYDLIKYEIDKFTGYMRVDRPQRTSAVPPALYGFIPRTYCGDRVAGLSPHAGQGDADPLDVCVFSERAITRAEVILNAQVIGGIETVDDGEVDDKIIAVLANDNIWGGLHDVADLPDALVERLRHYFSTYKLVLGQPPKVKVEDVYGHERACQIIEASIADYRTEFGATD